MPEPSEICARCGARLAPQSALGALCPRCLLLLAFERRSGAPPDDAPGTAFGPYRLVRPLGEGGMGVVWLGEQEYPISRTVAIKVVKPGANSDQVLSRFESERQTLAILNHEHIAKVFDAGATDDGRPYFVMEYVSGLPITGFADAHALSITDRLRLFLQVCSAVQHAHQKGVLHRDLKPTNILVTDRDGGYIVKVIDFGIAKAMGPVLTEHTLATEHGVLVGTPDYLSPEQADLSDATLDTRTDIYLLGLVLYELLAGAPPFDARELRERGVLEMLRVIREEEPKPLTARLTNQGVAAAAEIARARHTELRALVKRLRGDLEWITGRTLEKDPARRYASASELGGDIERHLNGDPVLAGPPSAVYRLRKLARRHRAAAAAIVVIAATVSVSALVSTFSLVRALRAEDRTRRQFIGSLVAQGMQKVDEWDPLTGLVYLTKALELETDPDRIRSHRIRIGETLQRSPRLVALWRHSGPVTFLALSPAGVVASGSADGTIELRDLATAQHVGKNLTQGSPIRDGAFSPDGAALAVASEDGHVRVWDSKTGSLLRDFIGSGATADIAYSPDGALIAAVASDGRLSVWNLRSATLQFAGAHAGEGRRVEFSHAGALLASAGADGVRLWRVPGGTPAGILAHALSGGVADLAFSDDDRWIASAGGDFAARLWDTATGRPIGVEMSHNDGAVMGVRFADASRVLVTTSVDGTTRTWRLPSGLPIGPPRLSASIVEGVDVSANLMIASATWSGAVDLWGMDGQRAASLPHGAQVSVKFDRSGRLLVSGGLEGLVRIWDLAPTTATPARFAGVDPAFFDWRVVASPDGRSVGISTGNSAQRGAVRVFDARTGIPIMPAMRFRATNSGLAFSPDGRTLVCASGEGVRLWDVASGEPLTPLIQEEVPLSVAAFSSTGETFAVAGSTQSGARLSGVRIRSARDGVPRTELLRYDGYVQDLQFSPDGRRLLIGTNGAAPNVHVWDVTNARLLWSATHEGALPIAWTADGTRIFAGGADQQVRAWSAVDGVPLPWTLKLLGDVWALALTADGTRLLAGASGGNLRLADISDGVRPLATMSHKGIVYDSQFSVDGSLALTSAGDRTARLWDGKSGEPLTPSLGAGSISRSAAFFDDGRAWAWTGAGTFTDELTHDDRPVEVLRALVESASTRTLSATGGEIALAAQDIEARFQASRPADSGPGAPSTDYSRARAHDAWRRKRFDVLLSHLEVLRARNALQWSDRMLGIGAFAVLQRWADALSELRSLRAHWRAAPELIYMEAVTLAHLADASGGEELCRHALDVTRRTTHPERAYWTARACLVPADVGQASRDELEARIALAYPQLADNLGRGELEALNLLRGGQSHSAWTLLRSKVPSDSQIKPALLLVAAAAAADGKRSEALAWLKRADAVPTAWMYATIRVWVDAEAGLQREDVVRRLRR